MYVIEAWPWWILGLVLLLMLLLVLLILYLQGAFHPKIKYKMTAIPAVVDSYFPLAMMSVSSSVITSGEPIGYWFNIDQLYAARLKLIQQAQHTIHFESFYMTPGQRADEFAAAIIERARAGVKVQFVVDSFGVYSMPPEYWEPLRAAGVEVRFFHRFDWRAPLSYNIRTHRKLLLIDGEIGCIGGTGVSDHWDGMTEVGNVAPWLDFEVCFKGPIVVILESIFMQHWIHVGGTAHLGPQTFQPSSYDGVTILVTPKTSPCVHSSVCALFYASVLAAKKRVWVASPYFLPDANSRYALLSAKKRGVDVRILMVGPSNDKQLIYFAVREMYEDLLEAGIAIYEYQPSMMHAKVTLIDDDWVSTGSANLDPRSLFHNDELNLSLAEPTLAKFVEQFFEHGFAHSHLIQLSEWSKRPLRQRIMGQLALFFRWQL